MSKVMVQLCFPNGKPSPAEAAARAGLDVEEVDPEFGVIATDPRLGLYTIRVEAEAAERVERALGERGRQEGEGVFGDPKIAPFWPPQI